MRRTEYRLLDRCITRIVDEESLAQHKLIIVGYDRDDLLNWVKRSKEFAGRHHMLSVMTIGALGINICSFSRFEYETLSRHKCE
jgi:hypothetical protein